MPLTVGHQPVPIRRKLVHKTVRAGVIGLSYVPHHAGHRREQYKEIQIHFLRRRIQVPRASHFWPQHSLKLVPTLLHYEVVRDHSRAVQDPVQLSVLLLDSRHHLLDFLQVLQIQLAIADTLAVRR